MRERRSSEKPAATSAVIPAPALARTGRGGNGGGSAATFFTVSPKYAMKERMFVSIMEMKPILELIRRIVGYVS